MANALAIVAEEIGHAGTLMYAGIGVAIKLNYEVMSYVLTTTARIVQLLLLLTQKTADGITIISSDVRLFLDDVWNGAIAIINTLLFLCYGLGVAILSLLTAGCAAVEHIFYLLTLLYCYCTNVAVYFKTLFGSLLLFIRSVFILFGSSVVFAITFIPNLLCLLCNNIIVALQMAKITIDDALHSLKMQFLSGIANSRAVVVNYFKEIPLSSVLGIGLAVLFLFGTKLLLNYLRMHHMLFLNNVTLCSFFSNLYGKIIGFFIRVCHYAGNIFHHFSENETEEVSIDADDQNGNENISDLANFNLQQVNGSSGSSSQNIVHCPDGAIGVNLNQNDVDSILYDRSNLTRRPLSRRQRVLGLADNVTEDEVLHSNVHKSNETANGEHNGQRHMRNSEWAKQLYRELEAERESQLCVICQDKPKRVILLPCRHLCLCESCRSAVIIKDSNCPMCRRPITDTLRVYV